MSDGILVAHDLTDRCRPVVDAAARLAARLDEPLSALYVVPDEELEQKRDARPEDSAFTDVVVGELRAQLRAAVAEAASELQRDDVAVEVLVGDPHTTITQYLEGHDFEFTFLGVRNRSRVGKLVFGSVAQSVLLRSPSKVVAVPLGD